MKIFKLHKPSVVEHLLVIRLTDLGQTAMTVHAVRGLRAAYPDDLRITVLTSDRFVPLFAKVPNLDFVALSSHDRYSGFLGFFRLRRAIRSLGADAIADLENSRRSRRLCFSFKPWRRRYVAIDNHLRQKELMTRKFRKVMVQIPSTTHSAVAIFPYLGFYFPMPPAVRRAPRNKTSKLLTSLAGSKTGTWIGVAPFSKHKGKCYTIPQVDRLVELLLVDHEKVFIIGEGRYEQQFGEGMERRHRRGVISLVGRCELYEELEALSVLDAVVTVDNPVLRLASLVGTPVVSLWGATHHFIDSCGYGQNPDYALGLDLPCRPCSVTGATSCLFGHYECMRHLEPERVAASVNRLLAKSKQ